MRCKKQLEQSTNEHKRAPIEAVKWQWLGVEITLYWGRLIQLSTGQYLHWGCSVSIGGCTMTGFELVMVRLERYLRWPSCYITHIHLSCGYIGVEHRGTCLSTPRWILVRALRLVLITGRTWLGMFTKSSIYIITGTKAGLLQVLSISHHLHNAFNFHTPLLASTPN